MAIEQRRRDAETLQGHTPGPGNMGARLMAAEGEIERLREVNTGMLEALRGLLAFPLALEPHCGESDGDLEIAIGHAADAIARATNG